MYHEMNSCWLDTTVEMRWRGSMLLTQLYYLCLLIVPIILFALWYILSFPQCIERLHLFPLFLMRMRPERPPEMRLWG